MAQRHSKHLRILVMDLREEGRAGHPLNAPADRTVPVSVAVELFRILVTWTWSGDY